VNSKFGELDFIQKDNVKDSGKNILGNSKIDLEIK
jgi:hypothetical protein